MMKAVDYVWKHSQAPGSAKLLLMTLAELSLGCIARARMAELAEKVKISHRQIYRDVEILIKLSEIERYTEAIDRRRVTRFHLLRWHTATLFGVPTRKCTHFYSKLPDLRIQILLCPVTELSTGPLAVARGVLKGSDLEEHWWHANQVRTSIGLPRQALPEFKLQP